MVPRCSSLVPVVVTPCCSGPEGLAKTEKNDRFLRVLGGRGCRGSPHHPNILLACALTFGLKLYLAPILTFYPGHMCAQAKRAFFMAETLAFDLAFSLAPRVASGKILTSSLAFMLNLFCNVFDILFRIFWHNFDILVGILSGFVLRLYSGFQFDILFGIYIVV